jgi:hypothetical protein
MGVVYCNLDTLYLNADWLQRISFMSPHMQHILTRTIWKNDCRLSAADYTIDRHRRSASAHGHSSAVVEYLDHIACDGNIADQ